MAYLKRINISVFVVHRQLKGSERQKRDKLYSDARAEGVTSHKEIAERVQHHDIFKKNGKSVPLHSIERDVDRWEIRQKPESRRVPGLLLINLLTGAGALVVIAFLFLSVLIGGATSTGLSIAGQIPFTWGGFYDWITGAGVLLALLVMLRLVGGLSNPKR